MDSQESLTERIEGYLDGTMDPAQQLVFEQELATDPELKLMVHKHRKANVAINYALRQSMKERLKAIDRETDTGATGSTTLRIRFQRFAVAASVLVLIAAGLHFYAHQNYSSSAIAEKMFAETQTEQFRSDNTQGGESGDVFVRAEQLFRAGQFEEAAKQYQSILDTGSLLQGKAEWNLALCYYAEDPSSPRFKALFDKILADPNHDYQADAVKLRESMHGMLYRIVNR